MSGKQTLDDDSYEDESSEISHEDESSEISHAKNTQPRRRNQGQTSPSVPTREGDIGDEEEYMGYENGKISENINARKNESNMKPSGKTLRTHNDLKEEYELDLEKYPLRENESSLNPTGKTFRNQSELQEVYELDLEKYPLRDPLKDIKGSSRMQGTEDNDSGKDFYEHNMRDVKIDRKEKFDDFVERKKIKENISCEHVGSDSGSETAPERNVGKQDGKFAKLKGTNKVCTQNVSHNMDKNNSESDEHSERDYNGKPARRNRRDIENITQREKNSKEKLDRNMPKYREKSESDSSECSISEKQSQHAGKETYLTSAEKVSYLPDIRKSDIRGEKVDQSSSGRKVMTAQSCSESDSDSDNNHQKDLMDQRKMRYDSTRKSTKKSLSKEENRYRECEDESLSELSDGFAADKEKYKREEAYLKNAPRRKKVISQNAKGSESDSYEQSYTSKGKEKHRENSDEEESYGKSFSKHVESIQRNFTKRNELDAYSNRRAKERSSGRNKKEDYALGYSKEKGRPKKGGRSPYTGSDSESEFQGVGREKVKHPQTSEEGESYGKSSRKQMERIERNSTNRSELDSHSNGRAKEEMSSRNPKEEYALGYSKEKGRTKNGGRSPYTGSDSESEFQGFRREKVKHPQTSEEEESYGKSFRKQMERIDRNSTKRSDLDSHSNGRANEEMSGRNPKEDYALGNVKEKYPKNKEGKSTCPGSNSESEYQGSRGEKFKHQVNSDEEELYRKSYQKQIKSIDRKSEKRNELDSHSSLKAKGESLSRRNPKDDSAFGYSKEKYSRNRDIKSTHTGSDSESEYQAVRNTGYSKREKSVRDYDEYGSHSDNIRHIERGFGSSKDINNRRKEASQYKDHDYHPRDFHRRSEEMRGGSPEFTHYGRGESGQDHHHHTYGMSRERKGKHADPVTHDERKAQASGTYEEKDITYRTRRPVDDDGTHNQNRRGQNRKPPCDYGYNSYKLHNPANGSNMDEHNRHHGYQRSQQLSPVSHQNMQTGGRFDIPDVKWQSQGLSVTFLINLLLTKKKVKISMNSLMKLGLRPKDVSLVIYENSHLFRVSTGADKDDTIYLCPQVDICRAHLTSGCTLKHSCRNLHICPRYLQSRCSSPSCVLGHRLWSKHNEGILEYFYFDEFPEHEVLKLLSLSPKLSLPHGEIPKHLKVCNDYVSRNCKLSNCAGLHICQEYLLKMRCNCQLSHNLLSAHNCQILENYGIDPNESPRDVLKMIKDRYPSIFKQQQLSYSSSKGFPEQTGRQQSGGRYVEPTRRIQSESRSNDNGNRNRGMEYMKTPTISASSENYQFGGTTQQLNTVWHDFYQGSTSIPEICYFSVSGKCRYEEVGCKRLHANRHFHWQVKLKGNVWINLRDRQVEALEKSYCDPAQDGVSVPPVDHSNCPKEMLNLFGRNSWQAHFPAMVLRNDTQTLGLRRICSENVAGNVKCARYIWYFLDQNDVWVQYGNIDTTNRGFLASDVTSEDIEKQYLRNPNASITFKNSMFTYLLDFNSMTQTNTSTKVPRKVRRRPLPHLKAKSSWSFNIFKQS